jgi:hypothetical protein
MIKMSHYLSLFILNTKLSSAQLTKSQALCFASHAFLQTIQFKRLEGVDTPAPLFCFLLGSVSKAMELKKLLYNS